MSSGTPTFEQTLEQLQTLVKQLESGQLPLEEALQAFERGVVLAKACQEQLSAAEKRVEILSREPTKT